LPPRGDIIADGSIGERLTTMKWLACIALCLMALGGLAGCAGAYDQLLYPEMRFNPGSQ
jgi:hypothetical protein